MSSEKLVCNWYYSRISEWFDLNSRTFLSYPRLFSQHFRNVPLISSTLPYSLNIKVGHLFCPIITKEFCTYSRTIVGGRSGSRKSKKLWVSVGLVRDPEAIGLKPKRMLWDSPDPLKKNAPFSEASGQRCYRQRGSIDAHLIKKEALES